MQQQNRKVSSKICSDSGGTFGHCLCPILVNFYEFLGLDRHLLRDISPHEDGLQTGPQELHLNPQLQAVSSIAELVELVLRFEPREGLVWTGQ